MDKKLVSKLAALTAEQWRSISVRMSWVYRQPLFLQTTPAQLVKHLGMPVNLPEEQWVELRAAVSKIRRDEQRRARAAKARDRLTRRREYMREYMRRRRETEMT